MAYGAGHFKTNVIYIFSNTGAFITTMAYCLYLHFKQNTLSEYSDQPKQPTKRLFNYLLAILTGILWYGQFFFYGLGTVRMGRYEYTSWAIHMIMLVLFSSIAGLLLKEWKSTSSRTVGLLITALIVLIVAVLLLAYGNYLGNVS